MERTLRGMTSGIVVTSLLLLSACGGGGGSSSSSSSTGGSSSNGSGSTGAGFTLSGVVTEGTPVSGASVCLSSNGSGVCDAQSPTAKTQSDGSYSLTGIVSVSSQAVVVASVPAYTDSTTSIKVPAHQLSALANGVAQLAAGKESLLHRKSGSTTLTVNITPFASLVAQRVYNYGVSTSTAATDVANSIGNGVQAQQLLQNYLVGTINQLLQQLALVLSAQFGQVVQTVQLTLGSNTLSSTQLGQAGLLSANLAGSTLGTTTQQVQTGSGLSQAVSVINTQTSTITKQSVVSQLTAVANPATQVSSYASTLNSLSALALGWDGSNYTVPSYVNYAVDSSGNGKSSLFEFSSSSFSPTASAHTLTQEPYAYALINNAWVSYASLFQDTLGGELGLKNFQLVSSNSQNLLLYGATTSSGTVMATSAQGLPVSMNSVDVSGQNIATFLGNAYLGDSSLLTAYQLSGTSSVFPSGSTVYTLSITPGATIPAFDVLTRSAGLNAMTVSQTVGTTSTQSIPDLTTLQSKFAVGSAQYLYVANDTSKGYFLQFAPAQNGGQASVNVYSFPVVNAATPGAMPSYSVTSTTPLVQALPLASTTVNGVSMLQITVPSSVSASLPSILGSNSAVIFATDPTGVVDLGWQVSSSSTQNLEEYFLNTTALNAIKQVALCPKGC